MRHRHAERDLGMGLVELYAFQGSVKHRNRELILLSLIWVLITGAILGSALFVDLHMQVVLQQLLQGLHILK